MIKSLSQILNSGENRSQYEDDRWRARASEFRHVYGRYCMSCRRGNIPISVHHINYVRGKDIWDYEDEDLAMLCEPCHQLIHKSILAFRTIAGRSNASNIAAITGLLNDLIKKHGDRGTVIRLARLQDAL